jgi:hypothetical protein
MKYMDLSNEDKNTSSCNANTHFVNQFACGTVLPLFKIAVSVFTLLIDDIKPLNPIHRGLPMAPSLELIKHTHHGLCFFARWLMYARAGAHSQVPRPVSQPRQPYEFLTVAQLAHGLSMSRAHVRPRATKLTEAAWQRLAEFRKQSPQSGLLP